MNPKKTIIITRSSGVDPDWRVEKQANLLAGDYGIKVLCWDRERKSKKFEKKDNYTIYRCQIKGKYSGGLKNMFFLFIWWIYEFFWLLKTPFDIVHACDFDTYLPALIVTKLKRKKVIYDMIDFYSDMVPVPDFLKNIIKKIDLFLIQFADGVIIVDDNRKNQIAGSRPKRLIVIYNTPQDLYEKFKSNIKELLSSSTFILGYIGIIAEDRGCDTLIKIVSEMPEIIFILGGFSFTESEKDIREKVKNIPNIKFIGKISSCERISEIFSKCDAIFTLYDPKVPINKYSSPTKIFEAMMLGKSLVVSKGTSMDKIIDRYKCGIIVDHDNEAQIKKAILELISIKKKGNNFYGENGRKAYMDVFHNDIMKERLLDLCSDILGN